MNDLVRGSYGVNVTDNVPKISFTLASESQGYSLFSNNFVEMKQSSYNHCYALQDCRWGTSYDNLPYTAKKGDRLSISLGTVYYFTAR